jgi:L-threonylcarbamoyladenylate synthase
MTQITNALGELRAGRPIVLPTETVYGVAARPTQDGLKRLFELKGRPRSKPIPILGPDVDTLSEVVDFDDRARHIADHFWPGPLTLILPRAVGFGVALGAEEARGVAVRVPRDDLALEILASIGNIAVTSANQSGAPPASSVAEARATFGEAVRVYVDGGARRGRPSTLLSLLDDPKIIRPGPISIDEIVAEMSRS